MIKLSNITLTLTLSTIVIFDYCKKNRLAGQSILNNAKTNIPLHLVCYCIRLFIPALLLLIKK